MRLDKNGQLTQDKPGYLTKATYDEARKLQKKLIREDNHTPPFKMLDCWLLLSDKVEEKTSTGLILNLHKYDKEREAQYVVLASGPGWRTSIGKLGKEVETGQIVPTGIKRGDIVQVLERLPQPVEFSGYKYHLVESHKVLFIIE